MNPRRRRELKAQREMAKIETKNINEIKKIEENTQTEPDIIFSEPVLVEAPEREKENEPENIDATYENEIEELETSEQISLDDLEQPIIKKEKKKGGNKKKKVKDPSDN